MRVHPLFQQHKIYFPEELKESADMKEVLNELAYITYEGIGSKHDDALDCISMIASMDVIAPSEDVEIVSYREESKDYIWHRYGGKDDEDSVSSVVF